MSHSGTFFALISLLVFAGAAHGATAFKPDVDCGLRNQGQLRDPLLLNASVRANAFKRQRCDKLSGDLAPHKDAIQKVAKATVRVWCQVNGEPVVNLPKSKEEIEKSFYSGNGTYIEDTKTIVTARHNLALDGLHVSDKFADPQACVIEDSAGGFHRIKKANYKSGTDMMSDVAVLETDTEAEGIEPLRFSNGTLHMDDQVFHVANNHESPPKGLGGTYGCAARDGTVANFTPANAYQNGTFSFGGKGGRGNSGSAVFDANGDIIGIYVADAASVAGGPIEPVALQFGPSVRNWRKKLTG